MATEQEPASAPEEKAGPSWKDRIYSFTDFPWWLTFLLCVYLLVKLQVVFESPCSVLGVSSPITRSKLSRTYRTVSLCTHPDRLVGHRNAAQAQRLGHVMFTKVTHARDQLIHDMKKAKTRKMQCQMGSQMEQGIAELFTILLREGRHLGLSDFVRPFWDLLISLVTFEQGFLGTITLSFFIIFLLRLIAALVGRLYTLGVVGFVLVFIRTVVIAPFPTLFRLFLAPFVRWQVFIIEVLKERAKQKAREAEDRRNAQNNTEEDAGANPSTTDHKDNNNNSSSNNNNNNNNNEANGNTDTARSSQVVHLKKDRTLAKARRRKGKGSRKQREQDALLGNRKRGKRGRGRDDHDDEDLEPEDIFNGMKNVPNALTDVVALLPQEVSVYSARATAAAAVQFDFLLTTTKPIIPLLSLIATGQVFSGVFSSILISQVLQRLPRVSSETLHLLAVALGALHTVLGVTAHDVQSTAEVGGTLMLQWNWRFQDVLAIANMVLMGTTLSSAAGIGNEPLLCTSFASGIALRILFHDIIPEPSQWVPGVADMLMNLKVSFNTLDDVAFRAQQGVGTCGGGPFRALFGVSYASLAAWAFKVFIMLLPVLYVAQWIRRAREKPIPFACGKCGHAFTTAKELKEHAKQAHAGKDKIAKSKHVSKAAVRRRRTLSILLATLGGVQVLLLASFTFNGLNGTLAHFWVASLVGVVCESLIATHDVRGKARQALFLLVFLLL